MVADPSAPQTDHMTRRDRCAGVSRVAASRDRLYRGCNLAENSSERISGELAITNGSGSITRNGINVTADRAAAILSNRAGHYFNVHTALNPDGAIRGQLSEGSFNPGAAVPY